MAIDAQSLRSVPLFQLMDDTEIAELAAHVSEMTYHAKEVIFRAGDPGDNMQIILSGRVEISIMDNDGRQVVMQVLEKGDFFGELSLFDREPRSADALTLEQTTTAVIHHDSLEPLFSMKPSIALEILAVLGKRLRHADTLVQERVLRNVNDVSDEAMTFGQRAADAMASFGGSWRFLFLFLGTLGVWIIVNSLFLKDPFDPYPFIFLNLILSMMSAIQAPIIMMSQNRAEVKDRLRADLDYQTNLKAEIEITELHTKLDSMRADINAILQKI